MSLLNLKSIFQEETKLRTEDYVDRRPQHSNDSRFGFNVPVSGFDFENKTSLNPILDTLLRSSNTPQSKLQFVTTNPQGELVANYAMNNFDPRVKIAKAGTIYSNVYPYKGTNRDNEGEGNLFTNTANLGIDLSSSNGYQSLYNNDHTPKPIPTTPDPTNPFQPYNYGSNVNRGKLDIRANNSNFSLISPSRTPFLGLGQGEPYIVSKIPEVNNDFFGTGRFTNFGSQEVPIVRALTDTLRITKYLSSPAGIVNTALRNIHGNLIKTAVINDGRESFSNVAKLKRIPQRYNVSRFSGVNITHNPLHTLIAVGSRLLGTGVPNIKIESGGNFFDNNKYPVFNPFSNTSDIWDSINGPNPIGLVIPSNLPPASSTISGDRVTLKSFDDNESFDDKPKSGFGSNTTDVYDSQTSNGLDSFLDDGTDDSLPLYFIDLRDNQVIYFRGYLDGITENISPSWSESNYIGRSEPTYVYERSSRDISFNLKLFAHTQDELTMIYKKMNKLTSLCYPEYAKDNFIGGQKLRMKPPLTKFRMGEIFGRKKQELTGFIKSLSLSVPEESTWETSTGTNESDDFFGEDSKEMNRVPKHIVVAIEYQVIHSSVPNKDTSFYGYKKESTSIL